MILCKEMSYNLYLTIYKRIISDTFPLKSFTSWNYHTIDNNFSVDYVLFIIDIYNIWYKTKLFINFDN